MNDKQIIIAELQEANQSQNILIIDIMPLRKKARDIMITHQSILIFTSDSQATNKCILEKMLYIDNIRYHVDRYISNVIDV